MKTIALLAAFAASTMLASPVMAGGAKHSDSKAQMHSSKKAHHAKMKQSRTMQNERRAMATQREPGLFDDHWDDDRFAHNSWNRGSNTGFFPLDFATGVTAGAVGTAGAIAGGAVNAAGAIAGGAVNTAGAVATAPFRNDWSPRRDAYASYSEPMFAPAPVSRINGPTCQIGTWTTINGQKMRCQ